MSLAFIHDWIVGLRGGERCLLAFLKLYPGSKVYSMFYKKNKSHQLIDKSFHRASILNNFPYSDKLYKLLLPLYPLIGILKTDQSSAVISLSHAAAKNINKHNSMHICYCFTPMRYIWDQVTVYLGWKRLLLWPYILLLRIWDKKCAKNVDHFVAISAFVAARIRRFYGRKATVIYPPVAKEWINSTYAKKPVGLNEERKYFLFASALVPYKGAEIALQACKNLKLPICIAGAGPQFNKLKSMAAGDSDIQLLGKVSDAELAYLLLNCRALIFPCKEDFGILPIEAQFAGKPVIALYAGACKETIVGFKSWHTMNFKNWDFKDCSGVFIKNSRNRKMLLQNTESAIKSFLQNEADFDPQICKKSAERYSAGSFFDSWSSLVNNLDSPDLKNLPPRAQFIEQYEMLRISENKC